MKHVDWKVDWSNAPEWANFVAMDKEGRWCWYEEEPYASTEGVWRTSEGKYILTNYKAVLNANLSWVNSLHERGEKMKIIYNVGKMVEACKYLEEHQPFIRQEREEWYDEIERNIRRCVTERSILFSTAGYLLNIEYENGTAQVDIFVSPFGTDLYKEI